MKACLICGASRHRVIFEEFGIDILRCRQCGHVFSSYDAQEHYDGYFGSEVGPEDQFYWDAGHRAMYEDFGRMFLAGRTGRLLDVGCGLGFFLKAVSAYPGWVVTGVEISPAAVHYAEEQLGLANVIRGTVEDAELTEHSFDIITLWDVIEHISQPDKLLLRLGRLLRNEGQVFIHTPNVAIQVPKARLKKLLKGMTPGAHYLEARDHLHLYSMKSLCILLTRNGFHRISFTHLRPIQGVAGSRSEILRLVKNIWFYSARSIDRFTAGRVNLDNLFIVAKK